MAQSMTHPAPTDLAPARGSFESAIKQTWAVAGSRSPSRAILQDALSVLFAVFVRAIERRDGALLSATAKQVARVSKRYQRGRNISASVHFAVYTEALADIASTMSASYEHAMDVQMYVSRSRHMGPLIHALRAASGPMMHAELASRLQISPSQLTEVAKIATESGAASCRPVGRRKYYAITRPGLDYLEELERPFGRYVCSQVLADFLVYSSETCSKQEAIDRVLNEYSGYPAAEVQDVIDAAFSLTKTQAAFAQAQVQLRAGSSIRVEFRRPVEGVELSVFRQGSVKAVVEESFDDEAVFRVKASSTSGDTPRFRLQYADVRAGKVGLVDGRTGDKIKIEKPRAFKDVQRALAPHTLSC